MVKFSSFGISWKQSSGVSPTTVVDCWSPTRATIEGFRSTLVPPRFVIWCRNKGDPSMAIPTNRIASSPLRLSTAVVEPRSKQLASSSTQLLVSEAPSWPQR
mgnify:CR=1 FL=1